MPLIVFRLTSWPKEGEQRSYSMKQWPGFWIRMTIGLFPSSASARFYISIPSTCGGDCYGGKKRSWHVPMHFLERQKSWLDTVSQQMPIHELSVEKNT